MKLIASSLLTLFAAGIMSATPVEVTANLVNAGSPALLDSAGEYVGPYTLNVNGTNYSALCIDYADLGIPGQSYTAYESAVNGSLVDTYHPTWSTQYKEEAYLLSLILQPGADRVSIQQAAWAITNSSYWIGSTAKSYVTMAQNNYASLDFSKFLVISEKDPSCNRLQEFMIDPSANVATPEPATVLLMGAGLLGAGILRRKVAKNS